MNDNHFKLNWLQGIGPSALFDGGSLQTLYIFELGDPPNEMTTRKSINLALVSASNWPETPVVSIPGSDAPTTHV